MRGFVKEPTSTTSLHKEPAQWGQLQTIDLLVLILSNTPYHVTSSQGPILCHAFKSLKHYLATS